MAATFINTPLARGQLPAARGVLYTVPTLKRTTVTTISLVNTDTVTRTVNLYVNTGSDLRLITPQNLSIEPGGLVVYDDDFVLDGGWTLEAVASVASKIDYVVSGIE